MLVYGVLRTTTTERHTMSITDEHTISAVKSRFGNDIRFWDEGSGPLWIYRETLGIEALSEPKHGKRLGTALRRRNHA